MVRSLDNLGHLDNIYIMMCATMLYCCLLNHGTLSPQMSIVYYNLPYIIRNIGQSV